MENGDLLMNVHLVPYVDDHCTEDKDEMDEMEEYLHSELEKICAMKRITKEQAQKCNVIYNVNEPYVLVLQKKTPKEKKIDVYFFAMVVLFFYLIGHNQLKIVINHILELINILIGKYDFYF